MTKATGVVVYLTYRNDIDPFFSVFGAVCLEIELLDTSVEFMFQFEITANIRTCTTR